MTREATGTLIALIAVNRGHCHTCHRTRFLRWKRVQCHTCQEIRRYQFCRQCPPRPWQCYPCRQPDAKPYTTAPAQALPPRSD